MGNGVEFRLLGPVGVWCHGQRLGPATAQQRTVLATLLLDPGRVVAVDRLVTALWGATPPATARNSLQGTVSRLRRLLGQFPQVELATSVRGYTLRVEAQSIDLHRFRHQVRQARGTGVQAADAAESLRAALALWRGGPPLVDVAGAWLPEAVAPGLEEERLAAVETLAVADLALGRDAAVAAELAPLLPEHPLRERLASLLMVALHRAGQRAEALEVFRRVRRRFADELGIEPGEELQRLHQAILADREAPWPAATPRVAQAPTAARSVPRVPRQLPPDTETFIGREAELAALDALLPPPEAAAGRAVGTPVGVIAGTGGVGKTALAVRWAHRSRDHFPDGQLYVNLLGFGPTQLARPPAEAVRLFLDALDVAPQRIPASVDAQVGLYRSLLADRRMLVLLDNALDSDQVRPLLPNSSGCVVLVTSRVELTGLAAAEGARTLPLGLLADADARELLVRRLGQARVSAEADAVDDLVARCAGLPLALAIVAARAGARPGLPLDALTSGPGDGSGAGAWEDAGSPGALDIFDGGDSGASVRTVFSWSYQALSEGAARLFRLLGLTESPDISVAGAASLAGIAPRAAHQSLSELARAHLAWERSPGRYGCHDLLWAYAAELTHELDDADERRAALHRLLDYYLHSANLGDQQLDPYHRVPIELPSPRPGVTVPPLTTTGPAVRWFLNEHQSLLIAIRQAARAGFDTHAWQLACASRGFLSQHGYSQAQAAMHRIALDAARRLGDPRAVAHAEIGLVQALIRLGEEDGCEERLEAAHRLFGAADDPVGQAVTHIYRSLLSERDGDYAAGIHHNEQALALYRRAEHRGGEGRAMNNVGWFQAQLGKYREALDICQAALAIHRELGDGPGESATLDSLGYIHHRLGHHQQAVDHYQRSLGRRGDWEPALAGRTLGRLGAAQLSTGRLAEGRETLRRALTLLEDLAPGDADEVRASLARLDAEEGSGGTAATRRASAAGR
ncbi:tetratricopeptide repeat protein [Streptomyces sp. 8K308]|nr:tetratricopeptide repeat protein [Streptomyces sp. 8K308]